MAKTATKKQDKVALTPELADVIRGPVVTEKATLGSQHSQVSFKVSLDATKPQIKKAVEAIFEVKVKAVNTSITQGKRKFFKGKFGRRSDVKKAIVTLVDGQVIDTAAKI